MMIERGSHPNIEFSFYLCTEETQICSNWYDESNSKIQKAIPLGDNKGNEVEESTNNKNEINSSLQKHIKNLGGTSKYNIISNKL